MGRGGVGGGCCCVRGLAMEFLLVVGGGGKGGSRWCSSAGGGGGAASRGSQCGVSVVRSWWGGAGGGGELWGWHCWWRGGRGWVLFWMGVLTSCRILSALCVPVMRVSRPLAGRGIEVRGVCSGIRLGLWLVGGRRLLMGDAHKQGLRLRGLSVVDGCSV